MILVGAPEDAIEDVPRDATWMDRPVTRDAFLLSVALGAGRRPAGAPLAAQARAETAVVDRRRLVEGRGREHGRRAPRDHRRSSPSSLPPFFTLKVPGFGVATKVKRVWVATPAQGSMWCGGILERPSDKRDRGLEELHRERAARRRRDHQIRGDESRRRFPGALALARLGRVRPVRLEHLHDLPARRRGC